MNREKIEKAADDYVVENGISEAYKYASRDGFIDGAEWRINSLWKDAVVSPEHGKHIVVTFSSGNLTSWYSHSAIISDFERFHVVKWAYAEDFLPKGGES